MKLLHLASFVLMFAITGAASAGALLGNTCLPSATDAADAYLSAQPVSFGNSGTTQIMTLYNKSGTTWRTQTYTKTTTATAWTLSSTTNLPALTFVTCNQSQPFTDGMVVGWGVAAAMIAVAALMHMRKGSQ